MTTDDWTNDPEPQSWADVANMQPRCYSCGAATDEWREGCRKCDPDNVPTWTTYAEPTRRNAHYVKNTETGDYLEGDFTNARYAAGVPYWTLEDAETVAMILNGVYTPTGT